MKVQDAFPVSLVQLLRDADDSIADTYCVIRVEDDCLCLEAHGRGLDHDPPAEGERVTLLASSPEGTYRMSGRVIESISMDYVHCVVQKEGEIEHSQRRKRSRALVRLPAQIVPEGADAAEPVCLETTDANSLGFRAETDHAFRQSEVVSLTLDLGDGKGHIDCRARVVRCVEIDKGKFDVGVAFVDLGEGDEERLVGELLHRILEV